MIMKNIIRFSFVLIALSCAACSPVWRQGGAAAVTAQAPLGTTGESWCYRTLGSVECYAAPQRLPPETLLSVYPPDRYPASREAYARALAEAEGKVSEAQ